MGGGWGNWVTGTKEGMSCNEHRWLYTPNESLNTTSETNDAIYVSELNLN